MAQLDPSIILAGRSPDIVNVLTAATQGGQQAREFGQRNALNEFLKSQGAQVMGGDQNALNALAGFGIDGLSAAQGVQRNALGMEQTRLSMDATRQNMQLAQSQEARLTRAEERAIQEQAASMSAAQRQAEAAQIEQSVAAGLAAQSPEQWDAIVSQTAPDLVGQFENREMIAGKYLSVAEVLKRADERNASTGPEWIQATPEQAAGFGAAAGQINTKTGKFEPLNPPSGMSITSDGAGGFSLQQGAGVGGSGKPLTVEEGKNTGFLIRAQDAQSVINKFEAQGTELRARVLGAVPFGAGNYAQTPEFQQYDQAKRDMINAILRRESGAVIADSEFANADVQYFPQPGDSDAVIEQKRRNRENAIAGIRVGSGDGVNRVGENRQSSANSTVDFSSMAAPDLLSADMSAWTDADFAAYNKRMDELGL